MPVISKEEMSIQVNNENTLQFWYAYLIGQNPVKSTFELGPRFLFQPDISLSIYALSIPIFPCGAFPSLFMLTLIYLSGCKTQLKFLRFPR